MRDAIRRLLRQIGKWLALPDPETPEALSGLGIPLPRYYDKRLAGRAVIKGKAA